MGGGGQGLNAPGTAQLGTMQQQPYALGQQTYYGNLISPALGQPGTGQLGQMTPPPGFPKGAPGLGVGPGGATGGPAGMIYRQGRWWNPQAWNTEFRGANADMPAFLQGQQQGGGGGGGGGPNQNQLGEILKRYGYGNTNPDWQFPVNFFTPPWVLGGQPYKMQ